MVSQRFKAKMGSNEGNLFFEVPFDVKKEFGRARPPVNVTVNGLSYRSTIAVYGGRYYVPVRRERREAAKISAGDMVNVVVELDEVPRTVKAPPELAAALVKDKKAKAAWEKLSYSHKKEHAEAILGAKTPATRERRIVKALETLKAKG
jgi:hypothetical protein